MPMLDLNTLNRAQRKAVTWSGGPLLLLAGPGSGKTFTVTKRILYLLELGIPPEEILVITFTKDAALTMQRRFRKMSDTFQPVHFGTFHSVFYHILQESGDFRPAKILNDSQKKSLMISILKQTGQQRGEFCSVQEISEDAARILAAFSVYKNTGDRERALSGMPSARRESFDGLFQAYAKAVRRAGALDFDDMLFECRKLLAEDSKVRESWQKRFRHILIDEFQDCNAVQYEVVKLLTSEPYSLFVVGDDDQSIYGFRGAQPDILRQFVQDFHAERLLLDVNYRCGPEIVRSSLAVIGENKDRFPKVLRARDDAAGQREEGSGVHIRAFVNRKEQSEWLLAEAGKWREEHGSDGMRCALLFRTNSYLQRAAAVLGSAGIPFFRKESGGNVYEHFVARDIMAYLFLAAGDWRREHLLRVINRPVRYISREAVGEGSTLRELEAYYRESALRESQAQGWAEGCRYPGSGRQREVLESLSRLQRQMESLKRMSPELGVQYILRAIGYKEYLKKRAGKNVEQLFDWEETADWLKSDAGRFGNVWEWAEAQKISLAEASDRQGATGEGENLWLMTAHGAKGLEFDRVIIPDCNERVFPHGELQGTETVEEERRIFYVAMTRAKKSLELLYLTGDRARPRLPSRFLDPLLKNGGKSYSSSSTSSSNSQLSRYSSKASATISYSSSSSMKSSSGSSLGSSGFSL